MSHAKGYFATDTKSAIWRKKIISFLALPVRYKYSRTHIDILDNVKGPPTHDEEFADEYATNIRRRTVYNLNLIFLRNSIF